MPSIKNRNCHLDNVKFLLIFLVILGHALPRLGGNTLGNAISASFYFFHMPLMIIISGYFSKKTEPRKFWKSFLRFFESFIIFDVLLTLERVLLGNFHFSFASMIIPRWSLWYLVSLLIWRTIIQIIHPTRINVLICISVVIGVLSGFVPIGESFSFQRTCSYFPYFVVGYCMGQMKLDLSSVNPIPLPVAIVSLFCLPFITYFVKFPFWLLLQGKTPYHFFDYPLTVLPFLRLGLYVFSIYLSFCFLRIVSKKSIPWITNQGQNTLLYYLYHTTIIYGLMFINNHLLQLPGSVVAVIGYSIIVVIVIWLLIQISFFRLFPNLFSCLVKKRNI